MNLLSPFFLIPIGNNIWISPDSFFGEGVESRESDIKFFVGITVTDKTGVDHLAESSIFQKPLLEQLTEMREEFRNFTVNNPDQKFF